MGVQYVRNSFIFTPSSLGGFSFSSPLPFRYVVLGDSSSLLSSDDEYIPSTSGFTIMNEDSSHVVQEIETLSAVADDHSNGFSVSQVIDPQVENDVSLRKVMRDISISETSIRSALSSTIRRDATGRDSIVLNTHNRTNFLPELQEKKPKRSIEKEFSFLQRYDPTKHGGLCFFSSFFF